MKRLMLVLGCGAAAVGVVDLATRPALAASASAPVRDYMTSSGLTDSLVAMAAGMPAQLEGNATRDVPPEAGDAVKKILLDAFASKMLVAAAEESLGRVKQPQQLTDASAWFKQPLGKKMVAMEIAAGRPEASKELEAYAAEIQKTPPARQRITLVQRLDNVTDASRFTVQILASLTANLARSVSEATPGGKQPSDADLQTLIRTMHNKLEEPMRNATLVQNLFTFRAASDAELNAYIDWLDSPVGRTSIQLGKDAMMDAMVASADVAGKRLGVELAAIKKANPQRAPVPVAAPAPTPMPAARP